MKGFFNDNNGISISDFEKLILGIMFSIFTLAITYVYIRYRFIDITATYLDLSIGGLLVIRKGLKYNLDGKQIQNIDFLNENNKNNESEG